MLYLSGREGFDRPTNLTPTKRQKPVDYDLDNRTLTIRKLKEELEGVGTRVSIAQPQRWLHTIEARIAILQTQKKRILPALFRTTTDALEAAVD